MQGTLNMFSAKKVKLHGMHSSKWSTQDKITQYKGLINLYTRDRKIMEVDTNVTRKKLQRELTALRTTVDTDRHLLDNAIRGDKQHLRNTLSEHRHLQLAYQNSQPHKVIECVHQLNFTKRKALDKLIYQNNLKSKELISLKQEQAVLEDRLKYAFLGQIKQEKDAQIITGKVQDAILKREAAMAIKHIYIEIIDIMKKDTLYYDAILNTIENDGFNQSKCFLGATTLGQLATEYLDDRKQEYYTLESIIIEDMKTRKRDIKQLQERVQGAMAGMKDLLRKDSDINTCDIQLPDTPSMEVLRKDVSEIEKTLQFLKNTTSVYSYELIFPCLQEQVRQKKRLQKMKKKFERYQDILQNKLNHAELMANVMDNTMVETTADYKKRKEEINKEIVELAEKEGLNKGRVQHKHDVFTKVAVALRQLLQLSKFIKKDHGEKKHVVPTDFNFFSRMDPEPDLLSLSMNPNAPTNPTKIKEPEEDEHEALEIIPILIEKFTYLMSHYREKDQESRVDEVYKSFEYMIRESMVEIAESSEKKIMETSLLEGIYTEASTQLTREDIKKQSQEIVEANTKNEDLIPLFVMPKKSKFIKKKK